MKLLYFAWIRTKIGQSDEIVDPPAHVTDVASLLDWLRSRGPNYAEALANPAVVRVAVNRVLVSTTHPVDVLDEVAVFPPVTGG